MKKYFKRKNKTFKRLVSYVLVLALLLTGMSVNLISDEINKLIENLGLVMSIKAEDLSDLTSKYTENSYVFTSGGTELSDYSQCFQDAAWAASHANDTLTLNPNGGKFIFDANYNPIGNSSAPFNGTIILTTSADEYAIDTNTPIFEYVKDSVKIVRSTDNKNIALNINRIADAGDTVSPLVAKHVVGNDGDEAPYEWKVTLNEASAKSYSGVIYEMVQGAKINLTFVDKSTHTPGKDANDNIISGSIIDNKQNNTNYGILCGSVKDGSLLKAKYSNTNDTNVIFIGTEAAYCGGLIGEINNSTFELLSDSSELKADFQTAKNHAGFICGHAEDSTITLPEGYNFSGTVYGNQYAGGIAGYCKNTVVYYGNTSSTITLSDCTINNDSNAAATGGVFGYYECDNLANDILLDHKYKLEECKLTSEKGYSGGIAGEYKPTYTDPVTVDLNKYTLNNISLSGTTAGGLFGKYTASGDVTITDTDNSTSFASPSSSAAFGGIIGEYVNSDYNNTLTLSGFTVNQLSSTSTGSVGGVISVLNGATYVSVSGVSVTNVTADKASCFGGIISTLDDKNVGSFIDVTGNFTLSMASGKTYKGGAIAGSFKTGVIRLAGVTDISDAEAANGYAQLVYENDETLVFAKGSGFDENWTLKRNADTTASDLGQWGEVVRLFDGKDAEQAGIVSVSDKKVTIASVTKTPSINDAASFAKVALNMQLNDGSNHGALCFAGGGADKTSLLNSTISVSGNIDLAGTGLLGFMRDGGNGKYLQSDKNTFQGNPDFFIGSITGSNASSDKILLAVGETYGCDASGNALSAGATGGRIYLSENWGHDAQGLVSFGEGASFSNITIGGNMHVSRVAGSNHLYMSPVIGAMTNGATLTNVTVETKMTADRANNAKFYVGGVSGVFDGNDTDEYSLSISKSTIKPKITLKGYIDSDNDYEKNNTYAGGVLGLLKGAATTKYSVSITSSKVSPTIVVGSIVTDNPNYSYVGGMIGRVAYNKDNLRKININNVTMENASVDTKAKYAGGLLGSHWERTLVTIDGLSITDSLVSHKYSKTGSKQSGLVFMGSGKWDINSLSISSSTFTSEDTAPESFGLIVNEAYSGNDGLYINLKNSGYTLDKVSVPVSSSNSKYYVDEIAADTKNNDKDSGDILVGGNGTGIVNINMNTNDGTATKVTDTGTYQNQLYSQLGNLVANQNSRYYYNLDVMLDKGEKGSTAPGGEQFLLWSVRKYAAENLKDYFKDNNDMVSSTEIDLTGLSYYPIAGGGVNLPKDAVVRFGFNGIKNVESTASTPDNWARQPDDTGDPNTTNARNQHYLMQTGLFTTTSSLTANNLKLTGDFGYVEGIASGALINGTTSGSVKITGLILDGLTPSSAASYMLINDIDGTGNATPNLNLSNLRVSSYVDDSGRTLPVAKSLFGTAKGQNMTMTFSNIKLDARNGEEITDINWTEAAAETMTTAYGTSRSIFSDATFFTTLLAAKTSNMEYNYTVEEDWGTDTPRSVTYGKEITTSKQYPGGEERYYTVGDTTGNYTNPISNSNTAFDFSKGFLPYVLNYEDKDKDEAYPVVEIKVNYKAPGLTLGCGTYNDPYIITTAEQFETVANAINGTGFPSTICLPNTFYKNHVSVSWHDETKGCGNYELSGTNYNKASSNENGLSKKWNQTTVRYYLAAAYYKIDGSFTLSDSFDGIGKPNNTSNTYKGSTVFHGVIVGDSSSKPTITNPTNNPLIVVSNGAVIKNININVTGNVTRTQSATGENAVYGYDSAKAQYYGGVIGEVMGGDNIIDDVTVNYSGSTTLDGTIKHLIAEGGMVGAVVNGALIFRGSNTVSGRNVKGGGIYSNPYVGRVINGYAIFEKIAGRTGTAPDNGDNYHIDTIDRSNTNKLDVNYNESTISVPDAQALYIMSLITQSIAGTAKTDGNNDYAEYSPSYGYKDYMNGVTRLGDYSDVGCGADKAKKNCDDYNSYAYLDSVNNYTDSTNTEGLFWAPIPYIIFRYTKRYVRDDTTSTKPALDFPARKMTSDNKKFWDIILAESDTFKDFDDYRAFRGIGSVGIITKTADESITKTSMKVATFNGNGNTINLHISLPRYERNIENYYHKQPTSLTQVYLGDDLGHGANNYAEEDRLEKLMGLGLFDCVLVQNDTDHGYQFKNFTLQGIIEDKVYDSSGENVTGKTNNGQLFCVGGVVGKRVYDNNSDINFKNITFDGLTITGSFNCGGLIGHDAVKKYQTMKIEGCSSTTNGISVTGGHFDEYREDSNGDSNRFRNGIGGLVGMTFWCRPCIDGTTDTSDVSEIRIHKVTTFYEDDKGGVNAGGLIGYTGTGAEIKNIKLIGANDTSVIGAPNALNAAGFIAFAQPRSNTQTDNDSTQSIILDNCTLYNLSVQAKRSAAGLYGRSWNSVWSVKNISINNCAVIGLKGKHKIKAYGTGTNDVHDCVGGFISGCAGSDDNEFSVIQNSYIEGYSIEGNNVGGITGRTTNKPAYLKNLYVKDCDIVTNNDNGKEGGIVGYSNQNLSGYNLATYNVNYLKRIDDTTTEDNTANAGFILGANDNSYEQYKFIGIGAYHTVDAKVPVNVVNSNGTNSNNFFVYADYLSAAAGDITAGKGYSSSFGFTDVNSAGQPSAPFVNVAPHMTMGSDEYLTGDGASVGTAGEIYKAAVAKENTSNRRYTIGSTSDASTSKTDSEILAKYIKDDGTYIDGAFKISTAFDQFGDLSGIQNFAMLVINDDSAKADDITPFIKSYIRLVTNAAVSKNTYSNTCWYNRDAYSCGNNNIDPLYQVVINPCYYDETAEKFVLGTAGEQGLQMYASTDTNNHGKYYFDSGKADSASANKYQFSLIDVQFKDPTDTTGTKIAYHLYVPVYTKKIPAVDFSAVSLSETRYYRSNYANRIYSEIGAGKSSNNPSQLVESTNEWTTTFIRYTYPKDQIPANSDWNYDKSITLTLDANFKTLPIGTKMILVDPNANADKYYTLTIDEEYATNTAVPLSLSSFVDESGNPFAPQSLSNIMASTEATSTAEGHTNDLYEDYYISIYVPKDGEGYTHSIIVGCGSEMACTGRDDKANITPKLYSRVVLGDLFNHSIVEDSFSVNSGDGNTFGDNPEMTPANNVLKTKVTATVQIKNRNAGNYLAGSDVYHSFFITLTSHDAEHKVSDIVYGINSGNISNTTTYSYEDSTGTHTGTLTESFLGANYIKLNTGNILDALYDSQTAPVVTIESETTMSFYDITAFPYNINAAEGIGTQVSIKSSLAYREEDLLYSAMNIKQEDPEGKFYYSTTQNSAELSFNSVPTDDTTDEIGLKTNNKSLLGVNGKYGTSHPIVGLAIYNVDDIIDYDSATDVVYKITLYKKVTDENVTRYDQVSDISKYLSDVSLTDDEVVLTADRTNPSEYVFNGPINHNQQIDLDKMFDVDFSCNVLTGDSDHNEYANYKIRLTAELVGASNSWKDSYIIYTNAKFDPSVIDEMN